MHKKMNLAGDDLNYIGCNIDEVSRELAGSYVRAVRSAPSDTHRP
jgi:hypothetical protein